MSNRISYTYSILRYVHDVTTGEFVNVGVALYAPDRRFVDARCRFSYTRFRTMFPTLDGDAFRAVVRAVQGRFDELSEEVKGDLLHVSAKTVMEFAHGVLPADDSSLQWSPMGSGTTSDPTATLDLLYQRLVEHYDDKQIAKRRDDDDVWHRFSRELQQRQLLRHFIPKTIAVKDDVIEFKKAWKNGVWHCLAPVSFDLTSSDRIRHKAHTWLGQLTSIRSSPECESFRVYFLIGQPVEQHLTEAFESALSILKKASDSELFIEGQERQLSDKLAAEVAAHDNEVERATT